MVSIWLELGVRLKGLAYTSDGPPAEVSGKEGPERQGIGGWGAPAVAVGAPADSGNLAVSTASSPVH